jgi:hypothetical protein
MVLRTACVPNGHELTEVTGRFHNDKLCNFHPSKRLSEWLNKQYWDRKEILHILGDQKWVQNLCSNNRQDYTFLENQAHMAG